MGIIRLRDGNDDWRERNRLRGRELPRAWGEVLGRIPWENDATLTFDPKKVFPVNRERASEEAFRWLGIVSYACRRPLAWAYAVEQGRSGHCHVHALLVDAGNPNWKTLEGMWRMRNGHARVRKIYDVPKIALYNTKQAKDGEVVLSDTITLRRFSELASSNIVVPLTPADAEASDER